MTARVYGCHSKPRPSAGSTHVAQAGWSEYEERGRPVKKAVYEQIPFRMEPGCQYDLSESDKYCAGCPHVRGLALDAPP